MMNVNNTAFDFINSKEIKNIRMDDYFVLNETDQPAATLYSPISGIEMTTYTLSLIHISEPTRPY